MEYISDYVQRTIQPRNETEFCVVDSFDRSKFDALVQDGIMISSTPPTPQTANCEYVFINGKYIIKKAFRDVDWLQADGTMTWTLERDPIYRRLVPPPAEALNHVDIIAAIVKSSEPSDKTYVEYGVSTGACLSVVSPLVKQSFGVDIRNQAYSVPSNCTFHECTTDVFSMNILPTLEYHFAFIDADHAFTSAYHDFQHIYKSIQPGGYIFLHDTYPCLNEYLAPYLCNDCYKTPIEIKKQYPDAELVTLPLHPGLTIVRKPLV